MAQPVVAVNQPSSIAIGSGYVYYNHPGAISRAPLGGGSGSVVRVFSYPTYFGQLLREPLLDEVWFWEGVKMTGTDGWDLYRVSPAGLPAYGLSWQKSLSVFNGAGGLFSIRTFYLGGGGWIVKGWSVPSLQPFVPALDIGSWEPTHGVAADAATLAVMVDRDLGFGDQRRSVEVVSLCSGMYESIATGMLLGGPGKLAVDSSNCLHAARRFDLGCLPVCTRRSAPAVRI